MDDQQLDQLEKNVNHIKDRLLQTQILLVIVVLVIIGIGWMTFDMWSMLYKATSLFK